MQSEAKPHSPKTRHVGRPRNDESQPSGDLRILEAALEAFSQNGYDGVSTADIAAAADVAQSVVHYHFGDKETLWRAAVDYLFERVRKTDPLPLDEADDTTALERLKSLMRRFVVLSAKVPELGHLIMHEGVHGGPRLDWLVETHFRRNYESFDELISEAQASGLIKQHPVPYLTLMMTGAAAALFNAAPILNQVWGEEINDSQDLGGIADMITDLIFNGLSVPAPVPHAS